MRKSSVSRWTGSLLSILVFSLSSFAQFGATPLASDIHRTFGRRPEHVLLISVDGLHAVDLANYVSSHPTSTLAFLGRHGVTYTNSSTPQPSDSFPGLSALVTGGSPITAGLWYDVAYNRTFSPPSVSNQYIAEVGIPAGPCPSPIGAPTEFDESIDADLTLLPLGGGTNPINPNFLPRDSNCNPVYPHQYLRVNTIFEVVKQHGGRTAWTDKHPSYEWTNGPSGTGVDDFYGPEINSIPVGIPSSMFPGIPLGGAFPASCNPVNTTDNTPDDGWTTDLTNIKCYDMTHVQAVLNQIDGWNHDHSRWVGVPNLFGTNFQAVSVGQKLNGCPAPATYPVCPTQNGYTDVLGTPSAGLLGELDFVDASLGLMVAELQKKGLWESTVVIVGAKHGQSAIDITKKIGIGGEPANTLGTAEAFDISDDGSLIWLADQSKTADAVNTLFQNEGTLQIQEIFALNSLKDKWNDPLVDPRTPDIILKVNTGVIYAGSKKIAEHGGINEDDLHVALLVAGAELPGKTIHTAVSNQQVAPTILEVLGMNPNQLQAVQKEKVPVLPDLF